MWPLILRNILFTIVNVSNDGYAKLQTWENSDIPGQVHLALWLKSISLFPQEARQHAEESLRIAKALLPENHLLLASSKRVLALILEEIAIDTQQVRYHSWIIF
jgi:hypothetical protein